MTLQSHASNAGVGCGVWGLEFWIQGMGLRVWGQGFRGWVVGSRFRVWVRITTFHSRAWYRGSSLIRKHSLPMTTIGL